MKLLFKNIMKKIFHSFDRFLSISLIIMIGVSVFIGLREVTPGMLYTADNYYDTHNLMDLKIISNYGLTDNDIKVLEQLEKVEKVIPSYSTDILANGEAIRLHSIEENVNNVYLVEGKMPTNDNECLGDYKKYQIGDKIKLEEENVHLKQSEFEVVGLIKSPLYISKGYGIANVGNGKLTSFAFILKNAFNYDYYTESYIIAKESLKQHSYKNKYTELINSLKDDIIGIKKIQENKRNEDLVIQLKSSMIGYPKEIVDNAIKKMEKTTWYILDRISNPGYQNYKDDALKVKSISKVLPVFFVIIGLLMCLNTLTRLIEEERTEIGIFQSNGFNKTSIVWGYLYYVFASTIIGLITGLVIGYEVVSKIIYNLFTVNYYLPEYIKVINLNSLILIIFVTILLVTIVTIVACNKELTNIPANLLRPKSPKKGKKIFLERFKKIWSKLSFMNKVTIRNLFRYKKRIIMTVLGVAGCTALLLTGFGLNDSINIISKVQYKDIIKYDSIITLKENVSVIPKKVDKLFNENKINDYLLINQNTYTYSYDNKEEIVYLAVPENVKKIDDYIYLKNIDTKKLTKLSNNGAVISNQMASQMKASKGDTIIIKDSNKKEYKIYINDIVYNYVSHYIYMTPDYYEKIFNNSLKYNNILIKENIKNEINLNDYNIYSINTIDETISTFDTFISSINNIIIFIIACACLLAFAVLYNLTTINVNERKREIATFKVLGLNDWEIFVYIYKEIFILTVIGIILGLILGVFLHRYVITTAQTGYIQFMYNINLYSYIFSAIITLLFSLLVQLLINAVLKKIDMIDSLKSVE